MPQRLIDGHAAAFDVTDTLVVAVQADPRRVSRALAGCDLAGIADRALRAAGVRPVPAPALVAVRPGREAVLSAGWRAGRDATSGVTLVRDVRVEPDGLE